MSTKEALPKAAFQYGVKMQDGRKTRKNKTEKSEKAELDREWQKIQSIMNKRKNKGGDEPDFKVPRHWWERYILCDNNNNECLRDVQFVFYCSRHTDLHTQHYKYIGEERWVMTLAMTSMDYR